MAKFKLTKGELKKQRDSLKQYQRYLPILQLKKQQIQLEILRQLSIIEERKVREHEKIKEAESWAGLLGLETADLKRWVTAKKILKTSKNIAGIDIPLFVSADFETAEYDLFMTPLWVDLAIEALKSIVIIRQEIATLEEGIRILRHELRITTQRVNLFEKIKIPESEEAIRVIKIYIGDQMANAIGRSKIAKRKIESAAFEEAVV